MAREAMLERIRASLGRTPGQAPGALPPPYLPERAMPDRISPFFAAVEKLAGKTFFAPSAAEAKGYVETLIAGRRVIASNSPFLRECGIAQLPGIETNFAHGAEYRTACAAADIGITSADYALAETGSLVMLSSAREARMISLLPPVHIAVLPASRILVNLDELLRTAPRPADVTSSMVLVTGPSRTADIEQILVRGVHGPAEIHIVVVA